MRRPLRERAVDWTIAGIAVVGWCVVAPTTVVVCELVELADVLRARWRELLTGEVTHVSASSSAPDAAEVSGAPMEVR